MNSEVSTIPNIGPTVIPYAISRTIPGIFILWASSGKINAPKDIITKDSA